MNLDAAARQHATVAHHSVSNAQPNLEAIMRPGPSGKVILGWATFAIVTVVAVFAVATALSVSDTSSLEPTPPAGITAAPSPTDNAGEATELTVVLDDPLVTQPPLGEEPEFDTSDLGVEQPLVAVDGLSLDERRIMSSDDALVMEERFAIGLVPGTTRAVLTATGILNTPLDQGFGGPGTCYWIASTVGLSGECHSSNDQTEMRPIGTGLGDRDWVGWSYLPAETSVAVLALDGVDTFWQRPRGNIALFSYSPAPGITVQVKAFGGDGRLLATGDLSTPVDTGESAIAPITGYGDFSDVAYSDVDWTDVTRRIVTCVTDQGFSSVTSDGGAGINFGDMTELGSREAQIAMVACRMGLNLPEPVPPSEAKLTEHYNALLDTKRCIEERGYIVTEPPPLEEWIASYDSGPWHPYDSLPGDVASQMSSLCP